MGMQYKEKRKELTAFVELLSSIVVNDNDFDINCGYEYFNNHSQAVTTTVDVIRQYEFVILMLKSVIKENQHTIISPVYLNEFITYIENAELLKDWYFFLETSYYLPPRKYYMDTLKYELVQFNVHDNMYVLLLKCMTFHETDVSKAMEVAFYFFKNCFDRSISISPQIKWKFFGNPYISITWILVVQKKSGDSIKGFPRQLMNEFWNDCYNGPDWKPVQSKASSLMDYMKKLTGFKSNKTGEKSSLRRLISRSSSFFEIDDTIFAKFSDDKETYKKWGIFSCWGIGIVAIVCLVIWLYVRYRT